MFGIKAKEDRDSKMILLAAGNLSFPEYVIFDQTYSGIKKIYKTSYLEEAQVMLLEIQSFYQEMGIVGPLLEVYTFSPEDTFRILKGR